MKAKVYQSVLKRGLSLVARAVSSRPTVPVLGHVLIEAVDAESGGPYVQLTGTDLETRIALKLDAYVERAGAVTVPAKLFIDLVGSIDAERIDLEGDERTLHVSSAGHVANLFVGPAEEFPDPPRLPADPVARFLPDVLGKLIDSVAFAAANEDTRPILCAVHVRAEGDRLTLVAADGFRLAVASAALDLPVGEDPIAANVPATSMIELAKMLGDEEGAVRVYLNDSTAAFALFGNPGGDEGVFDIELRTQLINGQYVNWRQIVPSSAATTASVDVGELTRAVKTARIFARSNADLVTLDFGDSAHSQAVALEAHGVEEGDYVTELDARIEGDPVQVSLNAGFLLDALGTVGERAVFTFNGASQAVKLTPEGGGDLVHVIMPMHVRG